MGNLNHNLPTYQQTKRIGAMSTDAAVILVVDDEEVVLTLLRRSFENVGYPISTASGGQQAIEIFREQFQGIAGVILDLSMPGMSSEEIFDALHEIDPEVRVVLTSGYTEEEAIERFGSRSLAGFIQKPFRLMKFIAKVCAIFELSSPVAP